MAITISNNNYDQYGNPTIYNGGTATTNSIGEDISPDTSQYEAAVANPQTNFQMTPEYQAYLETTPSSGAVPGGNYGMIGTTGTYGVVMYNPDGSIWVQSTDENGVPIISGSPQYSQSEIDSGIRIGGDTRTPEQIAADTQQTQQTQQTVQTSYQNRTGTSGTTSTPVIGPTSGTGGTLQTIPEYTSESGWGAANVTSNSFTWVNPDTGTGDTFTLTPNGDGTFKVVRSDGLVVERADRALFDQYFPTALGDYYFNGTGSTGGGGGPVIGPGPAPSTGGQLQVMPEYTDPGGSGWGAANVTTDSFVWVNPATGTGDTFTMTPNGDGTFRVVRSDGLVVESADRDLFLQYFPPALADYYYRQTGGPLPPYQPPPPPTDGGVQQPPSGGGGMIPGVNTGTGPINTTTQPNGNLSDPGTVGTADWAVQPGHSFTLPDGTSLAVVSVNPDGTITWRRNDGSVFANVTRDVFESLLGADMADQWYGSMRVGSGGGVVRVENMRDAMPEGNALPDRFQPAQMMPYTREIDAPLETVQGQLNTLLSSGSPLLQKMEAQGQQVANSKGLLNSTMGLQMGKAALMDVAVKIAEADANIYNAKSRDNMQALNAADAANVAAANQFIGAQLAAELQLTQTNAQMLADIEKIKAEGEIRIDIANAESSAKIEQILIDAEARKVMQANQAAATLYQNTITAINQIMLTKDPVLSSEAMDKAIARQITMFKTGIAMIEEMGGDVDLSKYLSTLNMALGIPEDNADIAERAPPADTTYDPKVYQPGGTGTSTNGANYNQNYSDA